MEGKEEIIQGPGIGQAQREKYWDELTDSEKIERMRGIIKSQRHMIDAFAEQAHKLDTVFYGHFHAEKEIVIPAKNFSRIMGMERDNYSQQRKLGSGPDWF